MQPKKKCEEDEQMQRYMSEEKAAEDASKAMKECIQRKKLAANSKDKREIKERAVQREREEQEKQYEERLKQSESRVREEQELYKHEQEKKKLEEMLKYEKAAEQERHRYVLEKAEERVRREPAKEAPLGKREYDFIGKQQFTGNWDIQSIMQVLNMPKEKILQEKPNTVEEDIWVTACGIAFLEIRCSSSKSIWGLVGKKALGFIIKTLIKNGIDSKLAPTKADEIIQLAKKILG